MLRNASAGFQIFLMLLCSFCSSLSRSRVLASASYQASIAIQQATPTCTQFIFDANHLNKHRHSFLGSSLVLWTAICILVLLHSSTNTNAPKCHFSWCTLETGPQDGVLLVLISQIRIAFCLLLAWKLYPKTSMLLKHITYHTWTSTFSNRVCNLGARMQAAYCNWSTHVLSSRVHE